MITQIGNVYLLHTKKSSYLFRVMETGHLEHLYYGERIIIPEGMRKEDLTAIFEKHAFIPGNCNAYDKEHANLTLEDVRLEISSYGKGDIREPFVELVHADGSYTSDFLFESAQISKGKEEFETLPGSYAEDGNVDHLKVTLRDADYDLTLELDYYIYEDCDVISRRSCLVNHSKSPVHVKRLLSTQLDFADKGYVFTTFHGAWAREMEKAQTQVCAGKVVNSSYTGTTSSRNNSFVMLSKADCNEQSGECYGFHLLYSGNHYEAVEVSSFGKTRLCTGMNPSSFDWILEPGAKLEAPEAAMCYSSEGFGTLSHRLHDFIREHIVRGVWKKKERPILLNSWEAAYFDINEAKLLKLAKAGAELGVELFVMDDGWFGKRDDDTSSLGDWYVNKKKLPGGVERICDKIRTLGMDFGIWVEPEMISVDSDLYRAHPDWAMDIPGRKHSEGRNQRMLDLSRTEVQDYIIEQMSALFGSAEISYVKWDMNRTVTDYYSKALAPERQGEVAHRYVLGLYRCMKELTSRFPQILFEGCSAGGNRFDPGILCYFPQIWGSDNTDAMCRLSIQEGYSYGYPLSVVGAHVSGCPNHQTLRNTPLETRFHVAAFGVLGYECNLTEMKKEELDEIRTQIDLYKKWRELFAQGDFYRLENGRITKWACTAKDGGRAVVLLTQGLVEPNYVHENVKVPGLVPGAMYHFYNRTFRYNVKGFGDLINTVAPIHVRKDSLLHNTIAYFVKLDGEKEDYRLPGSLLTHAGVELKQGFGGTGYTDQVRYFQDFASRMYFVEKED